MKPTRVRRGIESPHRRAERDGPNLGRVARVRDPKGPQTIGWTSRRGNQDEGADPNGGGKSSALLLWSGVFALATLLVIVAFSLFWMRLHRKSPVSGDTSRLPSEVRVASRFASPSEDEAIALVKRALSNRDPALVNDYLRLGESSPVEVVEFMDGLKGRDGGIEQTTWLSSIDVDGMLVEGVLVVSAGNPTPVERLALLVPDEAGVWKMDFEGFARTSRPSWKDFLDGRADRARVMVLVAEDSYYNGPFLDEAEWKCYALVAKEAKDLLPEGQELLRGYCRKDTPQARAMERILGDGVRMRRATLEISRVKDASPRQFEITRVLAEEWILPPKPFDLKFN